MSFTLSTFTKASVRSLNVRSEMHGKEPKPAIDIGFCVTGSNALLAMFETGMPRQFYMPADGTNEDEPELDGVAPISNLTVLRSQRLKMPLKLAGEYPGRQLIIDYGLGGKSNIELSGDVGEFNVDMKQGGTVEIVFRVQCSGVAEKVIGKLGILVKHDVNITLMSSAQADGTQEIVGGGSPFKYTVKDGVTIDNSTGLPVDPQPSDATDTFVAAHGQPSEEKQSKKPQPDNKKPAAPKKAPVGKQIARAARKGK